MSETDQTRELKTGTVVYDSNGEEVGTIRGVDEHGFYVRAEENVTVTPGTNQRSEHGDAIMWRCWECGEMGQIENIPEKCPSCQAPKEDIYYWQED